MVTACEKIVQAYESELAGMATRPRDQQTARLEQRSELLVGRSFAVDDFRTCGGRVSEFHQCIDRDNRTIGSHDQWIDIDAGDVGTRSSQGRQSEQSRDETSAVDCGFTAELAEQLLCRQAVDHVFGVDGADRQRMEHDIGDCLGEDATDTKHHVGPELRIVNNTGDQLPVAADHRCNQERYFAVRRRGFCEQLVSRLGDSRLIREVQFHQAELGLVRN